MRSRADKAGEDRASPGHGAAPGGLDLPTDDQVEAAVAAFALLADPTRLRLLWLLGRSEHDVGTLARLAGAAPAATSQHLAKLRLAGLVTARRDGRRHLYTTRDTHVARLIGEALYHADHQLSRHPDHP
ncbi:MAG: helix-turn-helix domain-containing protein [Acidimicrobiales bacterium]